MVSTTAVYPILGRHRSWYPTAPSPGNAEALAVPRGKITLADQAPRAACIVLARSSAVRAGDS